MAVQIYRLAGFGRQTKGRGAGHQNPFSLLAACRRRDGKVVLMRPSLPLGCFDLCA
ncbi:MAG: hypothetical protein IPK63_09780 [Candidatus Competibacteraceae bacterium]|nr:hypothetical protein [Candidatus Competibacteraceae bacterium]